MVALAPTVGHYLTYLRSLRRAQTTLSWYQQKLDVIIPLLAEMGVTNTDTLTMSVITQLSTRLQERDTSAQTSKGYVQVLKSWVHYLGEEEEAVSPVLYRRVKLPKVPQRLVKTLDKETIKALYAACKLEGSPWMVARDRAALSLLLDTGIRASEFCGLTHQGLRLDDPGDPHIRVIGKGDKERGVGPVAYETIRDMRRYLRLLPKPTERVFVGRSYRPLTVSGLDQLLYRLRDWAGLSEEDIEIRAHVFRHTFAVNRLRQGWDIKRLSILLGHTSVTTTEVYLHDFAQEDARKKQ